MGQEAEYIASNSWSYNSRYWIVVLCEVVLSIVMFLFRAWYSISAIMAAKKR